MERILVGIHRGAANFWASVHALNLAKRIGARLFFLLVVDLQSSAGTETYMSDYSLKKDIESFLEEGRKQGVSVEYYLTYGKYETELINFIENQHIDLLVMEAPPRNSESSKHFAECLEKIQHRINCRIELVYEKVSDLTESE